MGTKKKPNFACSRSTHSFHSPTRPSLFGSGLQGCSKLYSSGLFVSVMSNDKKV